MAVVSKAPEITEEDMQINRCRASICRQSFWTFVKRFWSQVPGAGIMQPNWHMEVFCDELQKVAERVFQGLPKDYDLICNVSPGSSKSTIWSILFPAWIWTRMPSARILTASHTQSLALDLSGKARIVIQSKLYQETFPGIEFIKDSEGYYINQYGGDRFACTVGGKTPTGFHAHFLIIDDPIDPQSALSQAELQAACDFMTTVVPTRKVNKEVSVTCLIMQRLHAQDPTGALLEVSRKEGGEPIRQICLPAELEPKGGDGTWETSPVQPQELAARYVNGLMDPIRLGKTVLRAFLAKLGKYAYQGQFLQKPIPPGGQMFHDHYFNLRVKAAPFNSVRIRYWDRAATEGGGCNTAGVLVARDNEKRLYIEHVVTGQWEPDERNKKIKAIAMRDRTKYGPKYSPKIYIEREGGSSGRDAWKTIARILEGFPVYEDMVTGDKTARAEEFSCQAAAGNVWLVEDGTWSINEYIQELVLFPLGRMKDQVDASTGGVNLLVGVRSLSNQFRVYSIRDRKSSKLHLIAATHDELPEVVSENRALWVNVNDPADDYLPGHNLNLIDTLSFPCADVDSRDYQDRWQELVLPWRKLPEDLLMTREQGKRVWTFLLKKRDPGPELIVFSSKNARQALAMACAICDSLHLNRSAIFRPKDEQVYTQKPENEHVYELIKSCRSSVVG